MESRELAVHALASLERLRPPGVGDDVWSAAEDVAGAAADLLAGGSARGALLARAILEPDARRTATHALAAALADADATWVLDAAATYAAIAGGVVGAVPGVVLDDPAAGTVANLLERSDPDPDASRDHRLAELYVAGTLVRASAREVPLQEGLDAVAAVEGVCAEVDELDVEALLRHVLREALGGPVPDEAGPRAALLGGAIAIGVLPRITGGLLNGDRALQRKGWVRAAAVVAETGRLAGTELRAADVRATASRLVADRTLLGTPEGTITDMLTTLLGLQATIPLGGVGDRGPAAHLLARLVAFAALTAR